MISDLDTSLQELLVRELPSSLTDQVAISFDAPDSKFPPQGVKLPAIDMFLYDIRENRELRSNEWAINRPSDGGITKKRRPVRVDCSYLVTAWASKNSTSEALDEHHLLGEILRIFLKYPVLPEEVLAGNLVGQEPPLPTITLHAGRLQSPSEFWQALGGKPKAAFHYTVTMGVEVFDTLEAGLPVIEIDTGLDQLS